MSSFTFMHSNRQRCEIDQTIFVMVDPNFQATNVSEMAWISQNCCGCRRGRRETNPGREEPSNHPAIEHLKFGHGRVFYPNGQRAAESRFVSRVGEM